MIVSRAWAGPRTDRVRWRWLGPMLPRRRLRRLLARKQAEQAGAVGYRRPTCQRCTDDKVQCPRLGARPFGTYALSTIEHSLGVRLAFDLGDLLRPSQLR